MKRKIASYVALFAGITMTMALGTGLIKVRQEIPREETDAIQTQAIYEQVLTSDLGFKKQDIAQIQQIPGVIKAEGSFGLPVVVTDDKGFSTKKEMYSLPETVNIPKLEEGRLPKGKEECVITTENHTDLVGNRFSYEFDGEVNTCTIVGKISFPFEITYGTEEDPLQKFYVLQESFGETIFTSCYLILEPQTDFIKQYEKNARDSYEEIRKQKEEAATILEAEWKEKNQKIVENKNNELADLLAKQKALGKIELKIDQDEANNYDKAQIAARRKEIESQKTEIAEKMGNYNDRYQQLVKDAKQAKEKAALAREEVINLTMPQIHMFAREDNPNYCSFLQRQEERKKATGIPLAFLVLFTVLAAVAVANSMLGERNLRRMLLFTGVIAFTASILGGMIGGGLSYRKDHLFIAALSMTVLTVTAFLLSYYGERACIRRKRAGEQFVWRFIAIQIPTLSMVIVVFLIEKEILVSQWTFLVVVGGSLVLFYLSTYAAMKKKVWNSIVGEKISFAPHKIIQKVVAMNYKLFLGASVVVIGVMLIVNQMQGGDQSILFKSYGIGIVLSLTGISLCNGLLTLIMRKLTR